MAPLGGWLIDRFGPRRVILGSLSTIALGVTGAVFVRELWQLVFLWGIVLGVATGVTPPLGASIASRRGLAIGIMTNANAAGQVVFLPLLMAVVVASGWRSALMMIVGASVLLIPAVWLWMCDQPADVGLEPFRSEKEAGSKPSRIYARGDIVPLLFRRFRKFSKVHLLASRRLFLYLRSDGQRSHWHALDSSRYRKRDAASRCRFGARDHGRRKFRRNHLRGLAGRPG
jgi:MFS family permease